MNSVPLALVGQHASTTQLSAGQEAALSTLLSAFIVTLSGSSFTNLVNSLSVHTNAPMAAPPSVGAPSAVRNALVVPFAPGFGASLVTAAVNSKDSALLSGGGASLADDSLDSASDPSSDALTAIQAPMPPEIMIARS
jgi:hypothetical protein